jgi:hypothetical protein
MGSQSCCKVRDCCDTAPMPSCCAPLASPQQEKLHRVRQDQNVSESAWVGRREDLPPEQFAWEAPADAADAKPAAGSMRKVRALDGRAEGARRLVVASIAEIRRGRGRRGVVLQDGDASGGRSVCGTPLTLTHQGHRSRHNLPRRACRRPSSTHSTNSPRSADTPLAAPP